MLTWNYFFSCFFCMWTYTVFCSLEEWFPIPLKISTVIYDIPGSEQCLGCSVNLKGFEEMGKASAVTFRRLI